MSRISKLGRVLVAAGTVVLAGGLNALTIDVQKAPKAEILNTEEIVTNVTFDLDLPYGSIGKAGLVQPLSVNSTNQSGIVFAANGTIYVNADPDYGLYRTASGKLAVSPATWQDYLDGVSWYKPITPAIMEDILDPFANRVKDAVEGNFASLDEDGDLVDSGYNSGSFAPSNSVVYKVEGATNDNLAVFAADGSIKDTGVKVSQFATAEQGTTADNAIPKIPGATNDHFVVVAEGGVVKDSGYTASSFSASGHTHVWSEVTDRPTNVSSFSNDANYLSSESDPSVYSWAKAATKPSYTWSEISDTPTNLSDFNNDENYIKLTEFRQAILAAVTNDIPVITDDGDGFTEEELARSINELAGALNRLRAAALVP